MKVYSECYQVRCCNLLILICSQVATVRSAISMFRTLLEIFACCIVLSKGFSLLHVSKEIVGGGGIDILLAPVTAILSLKNRKRKRRCYWPTSSSCQNCISYMSHCSYMGTTTTPVTKQTLCRYSFSSRDHRINCVKETAQIPVVIFV